MTVTLAQERRKETVNLSNLSAFIDKLNARNDFIDTC